MPVSINGNTGVVTGLAQLPDSAMSAGSIIQVLSTTKINGFTSTNSSFVDITGFSVDITPSSSSNKILIMVNISLGGEDNTYPAFKVLRGSTALALGTYSTGGGQTPCSFGYRSSSMHKVSTAAFHYFDSPSTTSSTTYKVQVASTHDSNEITINRPSSGTNAAYTHAGTSTITAMGIAA